MPSSPQVCHSATEDKPITAFVSDTSKVEKENRGKGEQAAAVPLRADVVLVLAADPF